MPDKSRQFDFLSEHGFTPSEQIEATMNATSDAITDIKKKALMRNAFEGIMESQSDEGQRKRIEKRKQELAVHGYAEHQIEHQTDEDGDIHPAAAHHHGDFVAHWEPGHSKMFVYHKSQDRSDANKAVPVGSIFVSHLHKDADNIPAVNQKALEDWHSKPENVAEAMSRLQE